jgi:hypothetical protein
MDIVDYAAEKITAPEKDPMTWLDLPFIRQHYSQPQEWVPRQEAHRFVEEANTTLYSESELEQFRATLERGVKLGAFTQEEADDISRIMDNGQAKARASFAEFGIDPQASVNDLRLELKNALAAEAALKQMRRQDLAAVARQKADFVARLGGGRASLERLWTPEQRRSFPSLVRTRTKEYLERPDLLSRDMRL